ncbi:phage tail protein [Natrinema amylolyticum]|uniref:phage tail protein n=1 Tax=Natrinema amylolyticum TaxID=2878679 RepID=UPI001CFB0E4F|nr:phage tail protein [Natrinema amylolyticum]
MLTLRIEHTDGTVSELDAIRASRTEDLDEQARAEATVYRSDWNDVEADLDERNDRLFLDVDGVDVFGGRFEDSRSEAGTVSVQLSSPETDANDAEPTPANLTYQNVADSTIVSDAITAVDTLSAGTVETVASAISYSASHASRSKQIRDQRKATGAEIRYNPDWTVDYLDRRGSDRGGVVLGPAESNIGDGFTKTLDIREEVTHVLALGAQDGPDQRMAEAVVSDYSAGKRPVWRRVEDKEIIDQDRLQQLAQTQVDEYDGEPRAIEVQATVFGVDLELGDSVSVDYPEENVSRSLRVVSLTTRWDEQGRVQEVTLSNRSRTRSSNQGDAKRNTDLQKFNRGYQGFVDRSQATSGWNPAESGTPQTLEIPAWPDDIVDEQRVELTVQGRAWRSPVESVGHEHAFSWRHAHGVDTTSSNNSDYQTVVATGRAGYSSPQTLDDNWSTIGSVPTSGSFGVDTSEVAVVCALTPTNSPSGMGIRSLSIRLKNDSSDDYYPDSDGIRAREITEAPVPFPALEAPENANGDSYSLEAQTNFTSEYGSLDVAVAAGYWADGQHVHGVDSTTTNGGVNEDTTSSEAAFKPGVTTTFENTEYYPSDVTITVNGTSVATIAGDDTSSWDETVDLTGELQAGSNTITAEPADRGELNLILSSELFRRGRTN